MNPVNPEKLLLNKWTAVKPVAKQKHFLVSRVIQPELLTAPVEQVATEAALEGNPTHHLTGTARGQRVAAQLFSANKVFHLAKGKNAVKVSNGEELIASYKRRCLMELLLDRSSWLLKV